MEENKFVSQSMEADGQSGTETEKKTFWQKLDELLLKDSVFYVFLMGAAAAVFAGTYLYMEYGTGAFNEIFAAAMLKEGADSGNYAAAAGFALGFLLARILEGPMVGLLDIGGTLQTGVGIGIPALFLALDFKLPFTSFWIALLVGAGIGLLLALIMTLIGKLAPDGIVSGGTAVLVGAGNAVGRYLAPLVILAALQYSTPAGIGAVIGAVIFYKWDKEMVLGALLGAMILGGIFL